MSEPSMEIGGEEQLKKLNDDTSLLHIIMCVIRPGFAEMVDRVEKTFYMPPNGDNNKFLLTLVNEFAGVPWGVVSVPIEDKGRIDALLHQHGFRLADGIPHMLAKDETVVLASFRTFPAHRPGYKIVRRFMVDSPQAYTLELEHPTPGPHTVGMMIKETKVDERQN